MTGRSNKENIKVRFAEKVQKGEQVSCDLRKDSGIKLVFEKEIRPF